MNRDEVLAVLAFAAFLGVVLYRNPAVLASGATIAGRTLDQFSHGPAYLLANQPPFLFTVPYGVVIGEVPPQHDPSNIVSPIIGA